MTFLQQMWSVRKNELVLWNLKPLSQLYICVCVFCVSLGMKADVVEKMTDI